MTIQKNLIADETVRFESKKHWMAPIQASFVAILLLLGAIVLRWLSPNGDGFFGWVGSLVDLISLGLVIAGIGWIVYNLVEWRTASFAVTNLRVMREEGLIQHRSSATLLSSLSDVKTEQPLIGRQLGYGDVVIYSQSGDAGVDRFRTITAPMEFRNAIMTEKSGKAASATPAPTPAAQPVATTPAAATATPSPSSSADAAAALASLADLRDRGAITAEEFEAKKADLLARM
jgi:Short C-terminal domain/Bacterial PH domain